MIASQRATGDVLEVAASDVGGVVDEDVEAAESLDREAIERRGRPLRSARSPSKIRRVAAARALTRRDGLEAVAAVAAVHDDVGAERGEVLRDAAADAGRRSGDERDATWPVQQSARSRNQHRLDHPPVVHARRTPRASRRAPCAGRRSASGCVSPPSSRWITRSHIG